MEYKFCGKRYTTFKTVMKKGVPANHAYDISEYEESMDLLANDIFQITNLLDNPRHRDGIEFLLQPTYYHVNQGKDYTVELLQLLESKEYSEDIKDTIARMYAVHGTELASTVSGSIAILEEIVGLQTLYMLQEQIDKIGYDHPLAENLNEAKLELLRLYPEVLRSNFCNGFFNTYKHWNGRQSLLGYAVENLYLNREQFEQNAMLNINLIACNTMERFVETKNSGQEAAHVVSTLQALSVMNLLDEGNCQVVRARYNIDEDSLIKSLPSPSVTLLQKK